MILAIEILAGWLALSIVTAPVLIPLYARYYYGWNKPPEETPLQDFRYPEIRKTLRSR